MLSNWWTYSVTASSFFSLILASASCATVSASGVNVGRFKKTVTMLEGRFGDYLTILTWTVFSEDINHPYLLTASFRQPHRGHRASGTSREST